jgi:hypothetical protein
MRAVSIENLQIGKHVYFVDPSGHVGIRVGFSSSSVGAGVSFNSPEALFYSNTNDKVYLIDRTLGALYEIDTITGDQSVLFKQVLKLFLPQFLIPTNTLLILNPSLF